MSGIPQGRRRKDKGRHGQDIFRRNGVPQEHNTKGKEGFRRYKVMGSVKPANLERMKLNWTCRSSS